MFHPGQKKGDGTEGYQKRDREGSLEPLQRVVVGLDSLRIICRRSLQGYHVNHQ